jgi:solute:Na+ symporter, SSS family
MTGHAVVGWVDIVVIVGHLLTTGYLGWLGYRGARTAADFWLGDAAPIPS